ncbi:MAG: tRNA (adenosine(37)-N6)-dimethylallyltransferase MiaA [Paenibacillaceae bacterium]|nr:tRNA (adenosine(37)-N6)-dimethylallyltransferase MiaA [Paenibacillaceae bacterium]
MTDKLSVMAIVGPTAVGKTKLSLAAAQALGCEIISGDSMQVYRGMDIGTAKATPEERAIVPHHLIDIVAPDEPFSAADFQTSARELIAAIHGRGNLPLIVGGTGFYIESLCYDFRFSEAGADEAFRDEQQRFLREFGEQALHDRLRAVDPQSADRLHPNDSRRVVRALEIAHLTGVNATEHLASQTKEPRYDLCLVGLTMDRHLLYKRIEARVDAMMAEGLLDETKRLLDQGYDCSLVPMQGLGYKEMSGFLSGGLSLEEAVSLLKRNTRRYAKRQLSWFRHMDDIHWFDVTDPAEESNILQTIIHLAAGKFARHAEYT